MVPMASTLSVLFNLLKQTQYALYQKYLPLIIHDSVASVVRPEYP